MKLPLTINNLRQNLDIICTELNTISKFCKENKINCFIEDKTDFISGNYLDISSAKNIVISTLTITKEI